MFSLGFSVILCQQNLRCYHWLSVSGNSRIMYYGILITMPYCFMVGLNTLVTICRLSYYYVLNAYVDLSSILSLNAHLACGAPFWWWQCTRLFSLHREAVTTDVNQALYCLVLCTLVVEKKKLHALFLFITELLCVTSWFWVIPSASYGYWLLQLLFVHMLHEII